MPSLPHRWARCVVLGCLVLGVSAACTSDVSADPPAVGQARSPEQAVEGFLKAVGAGHATDALSFLVVQPTDRTLLTDEVLADAAQPIEQITTRLRGGPDDERAVDVSYTVEGQRVTDTYQTVRLGQFWFVDELLPTVPSFSDHPDFAAVTVAGKKVTTDTDPTGSQAPTGTRLLPGRYQLAVDHPLLTVENAEFTVTSLHAPVSLTGDGPHAHLTAAAQQAVVQTAQDTLTSCLDTTELRTACGFGLSPGPWVVGSLSAPEQTRKFTLEENASTWSLDLGGPADLAATRPDWRACRWSSWSSMAQQQPKSVCVDSFDTMVRVHVSTRTTTGTTETNALPVNGFTADIRDPDNIRVYFRPAS